MRAYILVTATILLQLISNSNKAQLPHARPKLFAGSENKIGYPKVELEKIFARSKGNKYHVALPGNFTFSGTVVSSVQRYDNLKSFLIKSDALDGAMFIISKRLNADNTITYTGRIINEKYSDGYELKSDSAGNYYLNKINMDDLLQDK